MLAHMIVLAAAAATCSPEFLTKTVKTAAHPANGKVGVSAKVLDSSQTISFHGNKNFPMQSVYKLPIAIFTLRRVQEGKIKLDQVVKVDEDDLIPAAGNSPLRDKHPRGGEFTIEDLLRRAIVDSDGSASDVLLKQIGGTREVRRYLKSQKIKGIRVQHTEEQLIENTHLQYSDSAKPDAMVDLLERLQQGKLLDTENTARLVGWMKETDTGKDRIRAKLPSGTVADKTGSSGTKDGLTPATNDVALVTLPNGNHFAIAIFVTDSKADTKTRNLVIANIAHEVWSCWAEETK
ncbi:Beta-lactamase [Candidatus Koribacter versatilis Ellin345]|uniref:beta-lactamase n=1 Tax=Koribacter versatilis (strain Ellin345) TaxID=204669 RepID=Q1IR91_KORVE|nr:class A beta-lactamase [Candidatus Koribacter versatilis]ABF40609.1 Beta-lactamase [Candidatus Koribacter versatilis Ellin345]